MEYKIKSWSDIKVGQYQEIMMIETDSQITKFIESVAIILDIDPADIRKMSFSEYDDLRASMGFLSKEPESVIENIIEIKGKKYGLIPDFDTIDAGTFIDAEQFKEDPIKNLHYVLALIYRPVISQDEDGEYKIEEHKVEGFEKRANLFRDEVSIENVLGSVLFFSLKEMNLLISLVDSLTKETTTEN